jgi:predicted PurR-regulated permease PerM
MTTPSTAQPPNGQRSSVSSRARQQRALGFLALVALASLARLAMPMWIGLFLGALLAFTVEPAYARLRRRNVGAGTAALLCALGATLIISTTLVALSTLLVTRGMALVGIVRALLAPGSAFRLFVDRIEARLTSLHVNVADLSAKIESELLSLGSRFAGVAAQVADLTFSALLTLFFMTMAAYFVLRHWATIRAQAELLLPFEQRHTHALLDQLRTVGRQVLLGTVVTGLLQGLLAAIGYWVTGVPEPAFFGALTALASLIPGVGSALVWITVGVVLVLSGHVGAGVVELAYGGLVVGIVADYVIRPRLVGNEQGVPAIVTFIALFGGVEVFGVIGLIVGPVIATLSWAILKTYAQEIGNAPSAQ